MADVWVLIAGPTPKIDLHSFYGYMVSTVSGQEPTPTTESTNIPSQTVSNIKFSHSNSYHGEFFTFPPQLLITIFPRFKTF